MVFAFPVLVPLIFGAWLLPSILLAVARRGGAAVGWLCGAVAVHLALGVASVAGLALLFAALLHGVVALASRPAGAAEPMPEPSRAPYVPPPPSPPADLLTTINIALAGLAMLIGVALLLAYLPAPK